MAVVTQFFFNALLAGAIYSLMASGFSLIYNVVGFVDLAPGALFALAAFLGFTFYEILGLNIVISVLLAIALTAVASVIVYKGIYNPLLRKKSNSFIMLIASFGVYSLITGFLLLIFGAEARRFKFPIIEGYQIGGAVITKFQIFIIGVSILLIILFHLFLKYTKIGKSMRAVADNQQIASTLGINTNRTILLTFVVSAFLIAVGGLLLGIEQNVEHSMGFFIIVTGVVAAIIGGIGNMPAAVFGAFLIGLSENFGVLFLPTGYKPAIVYVILIVFLMLRPQGFFGTKTREEVGG